MIVQDLQYALRSVRRRPGFGLIVIATLALGIGVNTAMFAVVDSVLLQPLPYPHPEQLVFLNGSHTANQNAAISPSDFLDYRARQQVFSSLAAVSGDDALLSGEVGPERVNGAKVSADFFRTLGTPLLKGRSFLPEEETEDRGVAILSYGLWQRRFGGDSAIVGKTVLIDERATQIVGIAPPLLTEGLDPQVWRPTLLLPGASRRNHFLNAIGRLKPGMTMVQAQAAVKLIARDLEATYPEDQTWSLRLRSYRDVILGDSRQMLILLLASVTLVLLIACSNVASLLLARATSRQGEIALRLALGASRRSVIRQLIIEALLLGACGGLTGLLLAGLLLQLMRSVGEGIVPRLAEVGIDGRALGFTLLVSLGSGLIFGMTPAVYAVPVNLGGGLRMLGVRASNVRRDIRARYALVMAQVALSLILLVGAGLTLRSLDRLRQVALGFDPHDVATARIVLPAQRYGDSTSQRRYWKVVLANIRRIPGVASASATTYLPLLGGGTAYYWPEEQPPATEGDRRFARINIVADDYFRTLRIPLVAGRFFGAPEDGSGPIAVLVSRHMAKMLFGAESPIGKRIVTQFPEPLGAEIVGVVGDVLGQGAGNDVPDILYFPASQTLGYGGTHFTVLARIERDPAEMASALSAAILAADRDLPAGQVQSMDEIVNGSARRQAFESGLLRAFALLALSMALIGLYGVLAYIVAQRSRELAIRVALGAQRRNVFVIVVGRGMVIVGLGIGVGLLVAPFAANLLRNTLFQVQSTDIEAYLTAAGTLAVAGFIACVIPARRAMRVDPQMALRAE